MFMFALFIILVFDFDQKQAYAQNKMSAHWLRAMFISVSNSQIL